MLMKESVMEKKKTHLGGGLAKHSVFVRRRGCCELTLRFFFCVDCDIKEGPGICCMVVVPLFSPTSSFLVVSRCGVLF